MKSKRLIKVLIKKGLTIGSVESITAGLFASTLAETPGASKVFKGSLVTYQTDSKNSLLGIPLEEVDKYGVVSVEIASMMAKKGFEKLDTDLVVSFTGNAGPTKEIGGANVGDVYVGIYSKHNNAVKVVYKKYTGSRNKIRKKVVNDVIDELLKFIVSNFS